MSLLAGENQASSLALTISNTEEMYLQTWFLFSNVGINFQHVSFKDRCIFAIEVQRVVFKERSSSFQTLAHKPCGAVESS